MEVAGLSLIALMSAIITVNPAGADEVFIDDVIIGSGGPMRPCVLGGLREWRKFFK